MSAKSLLIEKIIIPFDFGGQKRKLKYEIKPSKPTAMDRNMRQKRFLWQDFLIFLISFMLHFAYCYVLLVEAK